MQKETAMKYKKQFTNHITSVTSRIEIILNEMSRDVLLLGSGSEEYFFEDDQTKPFRAFHHYAWLCPLNRPENIVALRAGQKPTLYLFKPIDFWYDQVDITDEYWADEFAIKIFSTVDQLWQQLNLDCKQGPSTSFYGPISSQQQRAKLSNFSINETVMAARLNWERSFKTDYEISCMSEANKIAARGHRSAEKMFLDGASERQIYFGFLMMTDSVEEELPYTPIIGINEKGAVLHYREKRKYRVANQTLLIDAGCNVAGYASDITRSYSNQSTPEVFASLIQQLNKEQIAISNSIEIGQNFAHIHEACHLAVGRVLIENKIVSFNTAEEAFAAGATETFFPHGFGHLLGLFVHDVAGHQQNKQGAMVTERKYKYLRSYRDVEEGLTFTVEPGIYFIDMFLEEAKKSQFKDQYNWSLIEKLKPCGGIRIEDNIAIKNGKPLNLTRQYLP